MSETEVRPWQVEPGAFPEGAPQSEQFTFLLRYAHLAPSSHNTQPWHFSIEGDGISVLLDRDRWLPVADADQRELYISVGCALENLLVAAEHFGFASTVRYLPQGAEGDVAAEVQLQPSADISLHRPETLFPAITQRHTNHRPYDGRPLTGEQVRRLEETVQLQVGQVFERLFLTATAMGMALQPMNQILQVSETRTEFEALLPAAWGVPQLTFRLGYAPPEDHTPRRELSDVLR